MMKVLNYKLDYEKFDSSSDKVQSEIYLPSIDISAGHFTDVGFRFRANYFIRADEYIPHYPEWEERFFDYRFFNNDLFDSDPE